MRVDFVSATRFNIVNEDGSPANASKVVEKKLIPGYQDPVRWELSLKERGVKPVRGSLEVKQNPYPCLVYGADDFWAVLRKANDLLQKGQHLSVINKVDKRHALTGRDAWHIPFGDDGVRAHPGRKRPGVFYSEYVPMVQMTHTESEGEFDDGYNMHEQDVVNYKNQTLINKMIYMIDLMVGIPWVLLDRDPNTLIRVKHLKPASRFRIVNKITKVDDGDNDYWYPSDERKPRTNFVNKFLQLGMFPGAVAYNPALMWFTNSGIRTAMGIASSSSFKTFSAVEDRLKVREIINSHNLTEAIKVWKKLRKKINEHLIDYEDVWYDEDTTAFFEDIVLSGGWPSMGKGLYENWHLNQKNITTHGHTLQAWETWINHHLGTAKKVADGYGGFYEDDRQPISDKDSDSNLDGKENEINSKAKELLKEGKK